MPSLRLYGWKAMGKLHGRVSDLTQGETVMRISWVFCLLPMMATQLAAQDAPPGCTPLVTIQSQGCFVRQVFTCESDAGRMRWVATHGQNGPITLAVLDENGMSQALTTGAGKPWGTLSIEGDAVDLKKVLSGISDDFNYQLDFDDGTTLFTSGSLRLTGNVTEIDGRSLQDLQRFETVIYPNGVIGVETDNRVLYDADLGLTLNTTTTERATGKSVLDRTPVDFAFPGEEGANSFAPLYGCEG